MDGILDNSTHTQVQDDAPELSWTDFENILASIAISASPQWQSFANIYDSDRDISNGIQIFAGYDNYTPEQQAHRLANAARDYRKMPHAHREWLDKNLFDSSKSRFPDTVVTFQDLDYSLATLLTDDDNLNLLVESLCVYARLKSKTMPGTLARQIALNENDIEDDVIEDKALAEVRELYSESLDTFAAFAEEEDEPVADGLFSAVTATVDRLYDCEDTDFCLAQLEDLALLDDTGTLEDYYDKIKSIEYRFIGRGVKIPLEERVGFQRVPSERFKAFLLQREKGSGLDIGQ